MAGDRLVRRRAAPAGPPVRRAAAPVPTRAPAVTPGGHVPTRRYAHARGAARPRPVAAMTAPAHLGRRAARGALVTLAGQAARIVVQLASVVILARLLDPGDYGVLAMVLAVVGVGEIFRDFGLSSAAVQAKDLTVAQRDNLFWINTAIGVVLAVLVFASAVPLAVLYDEPVLRDVTRVLAVTFVLNGLATQFRADLVR